MHLKLEPCPPRAALPARPAARAAPWIPARASPAKENCGEEWGRSVKIRCPLKITYSDDFRQTFRDPFAITSEFYVETLSSMFRDLQG